MILLGVRRTRIPQPPDLSIHSELHNRLCCWFKPEGKVQARAPFIQVRSFSSIYSTVGKLPVFWHFTAL